MTTKLPEPNFIERDADKITQEWIALYEEKTGKTLQPAQLERLLIDVGVYRENLLRIKIQEVAKSNLLSYAPIDVLRHIGELVGVTQLAPKFAKTTFKFELDEPITSDIIIPAETEIETEDGNFIFKTDDVCIIQAGSFSVEISATCSTAGANANNYAIGKITNLLTPIDFVENVYNTQQSHGGDDEEDVESLRERIRLAPESFTNAGSSGAYKFHSHLGMFSIYDITSGQMYIFDTGLEVTYMDKLGRIYPGTNTPEDNINCYDGKYAKHCGGGNTGCIGLSACGMAGFDLKNKKTKYPITRKQIDDSLCTMAAYLSIKYGIPVNKNTVFTHYEFDQKRPEGKRDGKIDITHLPYEPNLSPSEVGDYLRKKVNWYRDKIKQGKYKLTKKGNYYEFIHLG